MRRWVMLAVVLAVGAGAAWLASPRIAVGPTVEMTAVVPHHGQSTMKAVLDRRGVPEKGHRCAQWEMSPSWSVALVIYRGARRVGWANVQTLVRQCRLRNSPERVGYEIERWSVSSTMGRAHARIRGLSIAHRPIASVRADARWVAEPDDKACSACNHESGGLRDVGYRRASLNEGWVIPKWDSRAVHESSLLSLQRGVLPESTWSESVTLTVRGKSLRCTSDELGLLHDTLTAVCRF